MEEDRVENLWATTPSQATYFLSIFNIVISFSFFHSRSRFRVFLGMIASDSHSHGFFSYPSRSRILGINFFIPFPFPNFGNGFFSFPSCSRILGMFFFHSLPVPQFREWIYLFPFLNAQKSLPLTPAVGHKASEWYRQMVLRQSPRTKMRPDNLIFRYNVMHNMWCFSFENSSRCRYISLVGRLPNQPVRDRDPFNWKWMYLFVSFDSGYNNSILSEVGPSLSLVIEPPKCPDR